MHDSLLKGALRSLLKTFSAILGFFLAFIAIAYLYDAIESTEETIPNDYSAEIRPNALGVRKTLSSDAPVILEIEISGLIGTLELDQRKVEQILVESRENSLKGNRIKGILLVINSPGGAVTDADGIYRALLEYKRQHKVPIFAFVDGLAASGGYYIALAADEVHATTTSLVGSIGVITSPFINVSELMQKIGVSALTISRGIGKDDLDPLRPWKKDEDKNMQQLIEVLYNDFVGLVATHRPKVDKTLLLKEYGAKVFIADEAKKIGLIDETGSSRSSTLQKLLVRLGIEDDYYQVVRLESTNWLNQLFKSKSDLMKGRLVHEVVIEGTLPERLQGKPLYLYRP